MTLNEGADPAAVEADGRVDPLFDKEGRSVIVDRFF